MAERNALGFPLEGDPTNLPKWAQRYVTYLEREVTRLRAALAVQGDVAQTNVTFERPLSITSEYLPRDSSVTFKLPATTNRGTADVRVRLAKDGTLDINADCTIAIAPRASNCFSLMEAC